MGHRNTTKLDHTPPKYTHQSRGQIKSLKVVSSPPPNIPPMTHHHHVGRQVVVVPQVSIPPLLIPPLLLVGITPLLALHLHSTLTLTFNEGP